MIPVNIITTTIATLVGISPDFMKYAFFISETQGYVGEGFIVIRPPENPYQWYLYDESTMRVIDKDQYRNVLFERNGIRSRYDTMKLLKNAPEPQYH